MKHYICTGGCNAVSEVPGVCQAVDCPEHGHPLQECDCMDGKHYGKQDKQTDAPKMEVSEPKPQE